MDVENKRPTNPRIALGVSAGPVVWRYDGEFCTTETTDDFAGELDALLESSPPDEDGNITVPIYLYSDSEGVLTITDVNITYAYPSLEIVSAHGISLPAPGLYANPRGLVLTNTCAAFDTQGATQHICNGWIITGQTDIRGLATGADTNMTMTQTTDAVLTWLWSTNYWLSTTNAGRGSVLPGSSWSPAGTNVMLLGSPDEYYRFTGWTGTLASVSNPLSLTMDQPHSLWAGFSANLVTNGVPEWWLARHGWTNNFMDAATSDPDEDGMITADEWGADTIPTNKASVLALTGIAVSNGIANIDWQGGMAVTQYLECAQDSLLGGEQWRTLLTNLPPTSVRTNYQHDGVTNGALFFRIRAER